MSEFSACAAIAPSPLVEVTGVNGVSKHELTWFAAVATSYRVLRGPPSSLPSCTRSTAAGLFSGPLLTEALAAAGLCYYWYLVAGSGGMNDGPVGLAIAGTRIANGSGACP